MKTRLFHDRIPGTFVSNDELRGCLLRGRQTPDRGSDVAFRARGLVSEVVHCNDFTVRPLDSPHVTDISAGTVVAERDGVAPGPAPVAAKDGANAVGLGRGSHRAGRCVRPAASIIAGGLPTPASGTASFRDSQLAPLSVDR